MPNVDPERKNVKKSNQKQPSHSNHFSIFEYKNIAKFHKLTRS